MRKLLATLFLLLSTNAHAIKALEQEQYSAFVKGIGLNQEQIIKLEEIEKQKSNNFKEAIKKSKKYKKENLDLTNKEYNLYASKLLKEVQKGYEKDLSKIMNNKQKAKYLEFKSRVY